VDSTSPRTTAFGAHRSVRTFLTWLVLACLLPGVIGAVILFIYEYGQRRTQQEQDMLQTTRALVQAVDNHLLKVQAVAQALSVSDTLARHDLARFHQQARKAVTLSGLGNAVVLSNEAGQQLLNTTAEFGTPLPPRAQPERVRQVFSTATPVLSDVVIGGVLMRPVAAVDVPVIIGGKVAYALGIGILPEHFNALLKAQNLPPDWTAGVFDSAGTIIGRTHNPEHFVGRKPSSKLLQAMMKLTEASLETTTMDGVPVHTFYSSSPVTGWRVAIGIPYQHVVSELVRTLAALAFGVAALFGLGLVLARFMSARISDSLTALTGPAIALGYGRSVPVSEVYVKEAAQVADAIGRAATLLRERAAVLHARDRDLAEAQRLAKLGNWYWDLKSGRVSVSDSLREIYGRDVDSFPEMRGTVLPVESWERVNAASQEVMRTGKGYDLELPVNHGKGHTIWVNSKCNAALDEKGKVVGLRGIIQDITERKRADERLRQSEQELGKFKFFSDHANDMHFLLDRHGSILYANRKASERLGFSGTELLAMNIRDVATQAKDRFEEIYIRSQQVTVPPFEGMYRSRDGAIFPAEVSATVLEIRDEWLMFVTARDITERKLAEQRVREAALHDVLTGLPNRALVLEYCERLLAAAQRNHSQGALLFIDLDRFKPINDLHGHETGDRLLQQVGQRLLGCTRDEDMVGRLGGDEFVIVLPYLKADRLRAAAVAQHVIDSICRPFRIDRLELTISPSVGISYFPEHAIDVGTLIHTADLAMYQAKQTGRGGYHFYTPELDQRADQVLLLEVRLKNAIKNGELALHYQPVIDIRSGELVGAEALVRLADNGREAVGPERFIPIAESAGLIGELGEWVARQACRQHEDWLREGMKLIIAINVSPLQFRQRSFADTLSNIIRDSGIDPTALEIEVTESAVMEDVDEAVNILNRIKSLGVKVALDDFGTGYSSLSSLTSLPLDKLKVDQSFVRRIERDQASRAVIEAIIALGRTLRLNVVGEGIESEHALRYLKEHGCDQAQGYWFSRPLPPAEFAHWCQEQWGRTRVPAAGSV